MLNYAQFINKFIGSLNALSEVTLRRTVDGAYDPTTGVVAQTVTDYYMNVNLGPVTLKFDPNLVQSGDLEMNIAAADLEVFPIAGDRFIVGSDTYVAIFVKPNYVGVDTPIIFNLLVRK